MEKGVASDDARSMLRGIVASLNAPRMGPCKPNLVMSDEEADDMPIRIRAGTYEVVPTQLIPLNCSLANHKDILVMFLTYYASRMPYLQCMEPYDDDVDLRVYEYGPAKSTLDGYNPIDDIVNMVGSINDALAANSSRST